MDALELQLLNLIKDNWSLEAPIPLFHRNKRRLEGGLDETNIIIADVSDVNNWTNEGTADCLALLQVSTRIPSTGTTTEEVEKTKLLKHSIREEIYRIIEAVDDGGIEKPTGWEWCHVTRRSNQDNFDAPKILLGEDLNITIAYQRT